FSSKPVGGLPIGMEGFARGLRDGVVAYVGTIVGAVYGFVRAVFALVLDPLIDLLRLLRLLRRARSGS
ncbi:MAG: hypothetical protein WCE38_02350, partial [Burkholderiales bacterium]